MPTFAQCLIDGYMKDSRSMLIDIVAQPLSSYSDDEITVHYERLLSESDILVKNFPHLKNTVIYPR
jgi:hypothetical protein